jgi:hypothetical protein
VPKFDVSFITNFVHRIAAFEIVYLIAVSVVFGLLVKK